MGLRICDCAISFQSLFRSYDIVGNGTNSTLSLVSPFLLYKKTQELAFNNTVELRDGVAYVFINIHLNAGKIRRGDIPISKFTYFHRPYMRNNTRNLLICCFSSNI